MFDNGTGVIEGLALLFVAATINPGKRNANTRYLPIHIDWLSWDDIALPLHLLLGNLLIPTSTLLCSLPCISTPHLSIRNPEMNAPEDDYLIEDSDAQSIADRESWLRCLGMMPYTDKHEYWTKLDKENVESRKVRGKLCPLINHNDDCISALMVEQSTTYHPARRFLVRSQTASKSTLIPSSSNFFLLFQLIG